MHPGEQCDPFQNLIIIPKYQDAKMQERPNIILGDGQFLQVNAYWEITRTRSKKRAQMITVQNQINYGSQSNSMLKRIKIGYDTLQ